MALDIDTGVVKGEASKINGYVTDYKAEINNIYETIDSLRSGWEGAAKDEYMTKTDECRPDLDALGQKIDEYANWLTSTANSLEQFDQSVQY